MKTNVTTLQRHDGIPSWNHITSDVTFLTVENYVLGENKAKGKVVDKYRIKGATYFACRTPQDPAAGGHSF